jgi:hypothetical protein
VVEKENLSVRINPNSFIECEKKKIDMTMKMKFAINMYTQILNTISSEYNRVSKSVPII